MTNFNPVEKNIFVSLYGIDIIDKENFFTQFSLGNIEDIITSSGAHIDGRLSDFRNREPMPEEESDFERKRYIAMLSESTAAIGIFPRHRYASFLLSTCGGPNPLNSLEPLIYLFRPIKAEVRYFTSSSIDQVMGADLQHADEDSFWEAMNEKQTPFYYDLKSKEKEIKGIYYDLVSTIHNPRALEMLPRDERNPVENNMLVSMYGVPFEVIRSLDQCCSIPILEKVILKSNTRIIGRMTKEFEVEGRDDVSGFSYVGQHLDGVTAFHITPESSYVSFFVSGSEGSVPILSLKSLIELFRPTKAEVRYFSSSPISSVDVIKYKNKAFWDDFDKAEIPDDYTTANQEKLINEFYFDLIKSDSEEEVPGQRDEATNGNGG